MDFYFVWECVVFHLALSLSHKWFFIGAYSLYSSVVWSCPPVKRIDSIDFTRGVVMIIMALDHVRDLIHVDAIAQSPTNLETTTPILFFTRWITYLCAPIFVFLAGTSAYISMRGTRFTSQCQKFLFERGLYLILLEFIVVNFLIFFDAGYHTLLFEVIAAIGFGFIVLSVLIRLPLKAMGIFGFTILLCHNIFPLIPFEQDSIINAVLTPLLGPTVFPLHSDRVFIIAYPPIPWLGIMLLGFISGKLFELPDGQWKILFLKMGGGALLLFAILRFLNGYGDPVPWSSQKNSMMTFLSFLNVTKYPPSLMFCLVTLGIMFLLLAFAEGAKGGLINVARVYGKVPLFYFLAHFLMIHTTLIIVMFMQGFSWSQLEFASGTFGRPKGVESGLSLWLIYLIWIAIVLLLYKPCVSFGVYKAQHKRWWLRYL